MLYSILEPFDTAYFLKDLFVCLFNYMNNFCHDSLLLKFYILNTFWNFEYNI